MKNEDEKLNLTSLDPAKEDPGFWIRLHSRVMADAREELARRRMTGELSVIDVVFSWRRTLVPLALMAAAVAGLLLAGGGSGPEEPVQMVAVEEVLTEDLNLLTTSGVITVDDLMQRSLLVPVEGGF